MTKRRRHSEEFKVEAVKLVTEQGYSVPVAARNLGVHPLYYKPMKACFDSKDSALGHEG